MSDFASIGKIFILVAVAIAVLGLILLLASRFPGIGRLPGDIVIRRDGIAFYFPLLSCLILSIILTVVANLIARLLR